MALNTTPGADAESLCTVLQANTYHELRGNVAAWSPLETERKEQLLRQAYDWMFGQFAGQWNEEHEFGAIDVLGTIPPRVRDACALLALYALSGPLDAPPSTAPQVVEKTVGPITTKFAAQDAPKPRTFPDVARMVAPYLVAAPSPYTAKLVRN